MLGEFVWFTVISEGTLKSFVNSCDIFTCPPYVCFIAVWTSYKGESNENLKFVIKYRNFAPLSCKLLSMLHTACRMACRWQHSADARTPSQYQYKDGCLTCSFYTPLARNLLVVRVLDFRFSFMELFVRQAVFRFVFLFLNILVMYVVSFVGPVAQSV